MGQASFVRNLIRVKNSSEGSLLLAVAYLIGGFGVIPLMDAAAKDLIAQGLEPVFVAWLRFALSTILLAPLLLRRGAVRELVGPGAITQIIRATMLAIATVWFFSALETMPIADALAVYFVYPFLITLMAPALLGETVGLRRYIAVLVGFSGTFLIVRPGFETVPIGVYYVLGASVCFALFNVLTRKLSGSSDPWLTVFYQSLVGAVVLAGFLPGNWQVPNADQWLLMLVMIVAAVVGHRLLIKAYELAAASLLAPFGYFEIISAVIIGYLWFGDFPDEYTWLGIAIIVASGVYIALRERKRKQSLRVAAKP